MSWVDAVVDAKHTEKVLPVAVMDIVAAADSTWAAAVNEVLVDHTYLDHAGHGSRGRLQMRESSIAVSDRSKGMMDVTFVLQPLSLAFPRLARLANMLFDTMPILTS